MYYVKVLGTNLIKRDEQLKIVIMFNLIIKLVSYS